MSRIFVEVAVARVLSHNVRLLFDHVLVDETFSLFFSAVISVEDVGRFAKLACSISI